MFDRSSSTRVDPRGIALATSVATQPRQLPRTYPRWELIALAALLVLELGLDCVNLAPNGFGNTYYAAAVDSMMANWHRFFFASFDSGGFLMVDKPPVGLWVQTLSASALGFSGVSLILPQAMAGVLSVAVLYHLVRRTFGGPAGLLAGALLAISPINVVANRSNVMDSLLVLTTLLAAWALFRATETGQFTWLAVGAVLIGLGFNIKMLEAYIVLPSCVLLYLVGLRQTWKVRLRRIVLAGVILTAVSLCWVAVVQSTPPTQRPYVDSTLTNTELDLAFNYNGAQRLFGEPSYGKKPTATISDAGLPGPLRLFQVPLGGQVSWLLPLALVGLLASIWEMRPLAHGRGGQWWFDSPGNEHSCSGRCGS
jgi:4-amino-4-deoxy-L-arabinose transferase-like glycosyltransferase